jgi:hypothetical protein
MFDVSGDERGSVAAGRAVRLDLQPQFRGEAGARRADASDESGDGRGGGGDGAFDGCAGVGLRVLAKIFDGNQEAA